MCMFCKNGGLVMLRQNVGVEKILWFGHSWDLPSEVEIEGMNVLKSFLYSTNIGSWSYI